MRNKLLQVYRNRRVMIRLIENRLELLVMGYL